MDHALILALKRFGKSIIESGIVFASIAAYTAVTADPNINAKALAWIASAAFIKGAIDAAGRFLAAVKEAKPA